MLNKISVSVAIFVSLLGVVLGGNTASATSVYDNSYQTVNDLKVYKSAQAECNNVDLTTNWADYILDKNKWYDLTQISNPTSQNNQMRNSLITTLADEDYGTWSVSQLEDSSTQKRVLVSWTNEPGASLQWRTYGVLLQSGDVWTAMIACSDQYGDSGSTEKPVSFLTAHDSAKSISETTGDLKNLFFYSNQISSIAYPSGYEGELVSLIGPASGDMDEDGLVSQDEYAQGTSDFNKDTDGDGLSDYVESTGYPNRVGIFCDTTPNPDVCAYPDPLVKDVYVEIDWLKDHLTNKEYKPTATQLGMVRDAFEAKGINAHFDTGEFGQGQLLSEDLNELTFDPNTNKVDFFDLKNGYASNPANFNEERHSIWHYLISGYTYDDGVSNESTGIARIGDDDIFVSWGLIDDSAAPDKDTAIAGTIIHELGHNLCLSQGSSYSGQPTECIYGGVDSENILYTNYQSSMNYTYQQNMVNYSDGSHGLGDHNDWTGVMLGLGDFVGRANIAEAAGARAAGEVKSAKNITIQDAVRIQNEQLKKIKDTPGAVNASLQAHREGGSSALNTPGQTQVMKSTQAEDDWAGVTLPATGGLLLLLAGLLVILKRQ